MISLVRVIYVNVSRMVKVEISLDNSLRDGLQSGSGHACGDNVLTLSLDSE